MDEYSSGGGGKLKLKGIKVSDGRVKKKKSKKSSSAATAATAEKEKESQSADTSLQKGGLDQDSAVKEGSASSGDVLPGEEEMVDRSATPQSTVKTEAERKHEEMRRKRVQERLKREGSKTHKERVEELNKYLSRLSEHHDMPKIGPG
ncbi:hypothetical protein BJX76DRAFT_355284 [Aspergillus varians]